MGHPNCDHTSVLRSSSSFWNTHIYCCGVKYMYECIASFNANITIFKHSKASQTLNFFILNRQKLVKDLEWSTYIQPACLPVDDKDSPKPEETGWANGWGLTRGHGPDNSKLKQVAVRIHDENECYRRQPNKYRKNEGLICGGGSYGHDTCTGDSGGPLLGLRLDGDLSYSSFSSRGEKSWTVFGITSAGGQSCNTVLRDVQPAAYTNVAFFLDWIKNTTKNCCDN